MKRNCTCIQFTEIAAYPSNVFIGGFISLKTIFLLSMTITVQIFFSRSGGSPVVPNMSRSDLLGEHRRKMLLRRPFRRKTGAFWGCFSPRFCQLLPFKFLYLLLLSNSRLEMSQGTLRRNDYGFS